MDANTKILTNIQFQIHRFLDKKKRLLNNKIGKTNNTSTMLKRHCLGTGHPVFKLRKYRSKSNFLLSKAGTHIIWLHVVFTFLNLFYF